MSPQPAISARSDEPASAVELALGGQVPAKAAVWDETIASDHGKRDYWLRRLLALTDSASLLVAASLAFAVGSVRSQGDLIWMAMTIPGWLVLFAVYGLYRRDMKRISQGALDDLPYVFHALIIGSLITWVWFRFGPPEKQLAFPELVVFGVVGSLTILILRWAVRRSAVRVLGHERVLMVGESSLTSALVRKIVSHPEYALEVVGVMSERGPGGSVASLPVLGELSDTAVAGVIERNNIGRVIVSQADVDEELMLAMLRTCGRAQVKLSVIPRHVEIMGPSVEVDDIEGVTVLGLNPLVLPRSARAMKRTMDLLGAGIGLFFLAPVMALIAIAVKLDSPGPVFFRHSRIGRRGEPFLLPKFRTMVVGAESQIEELFRESQDPDWLKLDDDPRITRVGRFLRVASLDELPQLWTVLRGRMSLVGPRPIVAAENAKVLEWARARLDLAPGITGLWQVLGRTNIPFEEMVKLDYVYVTNWSLWGDIKLLLRTLPAVLLHRGAN